MKLIHPESVGERANLGYSERLSVVFYGQLLRGVGLWEQTEEGKAEREAIEGQRMKKKQSCERQRQGGREHEGNGISR